MKTNPTSPQDQDRERPRWELLLLLLTLLASFCCICSSTKLALGLWPDWVQASLLPTRQADYTGGPGEPRFALYNPRIDGEAATDIARLHTTPTGDEDDGAATVLPLPTPLPTTTGAGPTPQPQTTGSGTPATPAATASGAPTAVVVSTPTVAATIRLTVQPTPSPAGTPVQALPTATDPPIPSPVNTPLPDDDNGDDGDDGDDGGDSPSPPTNTPLPTATPTETPVVVLLSGRVFEDTNYGGGGGTAFGGGDAGLPNVTVELYSGSTWLASTVTDGAGVYTFNGLPGSGTFTVRAVSATIGDTGTPPTAGFNGGFSAVLAEQTYENDGAAGNGGAGALGGNDPLVDDTATATGAGPGDTNVTVTIAGFDVTGVDLGFAFNLVANTNNAGQGSLRQTITNANAIVGTDTLVFNIAGPSPHTIRPNPALPSITDPAVIAGTTQPGFAGAPVVALDGGNLTGSDAGLTISAGGSTVRGLVINRFGTGVALNGGGANVIAGNYIGVNAAGGAAVGNTINVDVIGSTNNRIGGTTAAERNILAGSSSFEIRLSGGANSNRVQGNYIGLNAGGTTALGGGTGVAIYDSANNRIGGTTAAERNVISTGGAVGVYLTGLGAGNVIVGNYLGTDAAGAAALGNLRGVQIDNGVQDATIGGTATGAGNLIAHSSSQGVSLNNFGFNQRITIRGNSIYANGGLGIDLAADGLTINDNGDSDGGPNNRLNFPVIESATITGGNVTVTGFARPGSIIEFFIADPDPGGFGEGRTYLATLSESAAADNDNTTNSYGPGPFGQDVTNRFSFTFPAGSLSLGDALTATATDAAGNTSEFGPNATVSPPLLVQISGRVFEDADYSGGAGTAFGGGDAGLPNVTVELYDGPTLLASTVTDAAGNYTFTNAPGNGTFTVRAVSAAIGDADTPPTAGFNGGFTSAVAEQTYEHDGATGNGGAGALGGNDPLVSDLSVAVGAGTGDTNVTVTVNGADVTGVDFGFNYAVIINTNDSGQGTLRQFILNANANAGADSALFQIPDGTFLGLPADPNFTGGVAVITPLSQLPDITDDGTTIDGASQTALVGDTNAGLLGAGGVVGVDGLALPQVNAPEIEIVDGNNLTNGLVVFADNVILRGLAIYGFGITSALRAEGNIRLNDGTTGALIEQNIIGAGAAGFVDPGPGLRGRGAGITSNGADNGVIRNNLIGFNGSTGVWLTLDSQGWQVLENEVRSNGLGNTVFDGISNFITGGSGPLISGNLIVNNIAVGIESFGSAGFLTVANNTILGNGGGGRETAGVRLYGQNSMLNKNIIANNVGTGVLVVDSAGANTISQNSIYGNGAGSGQIGLDLLTATDDADLGTAPYVTVNDLNDTDSGGNTLLNFPVIENATLSGGNLTVTGYARPGSIIEFFIADPDPGGFGEGRTYLATFTEGAAADGDNTTGSYGPAPEGQDTTNRFSFTFPAGPVNVGDELTATATDAAGNTSEFSLNAVIN